MPNTQDEYPQVVAIVTPKNKHRKRYRIYVPDFDITIYGVDLVEAMANAIIICSSVYYYNLERDYKYKLHTTYEEACKRIKYKDEIVIFIGLTY